MKLLILDNYDSFTYNLLHYTQKVFNGQVDVYRNDKIQIEQIADFNFVNRKIKVKEERIKIEEYRIIFNTG